MVNHQGKQLIYWGAGVFCKYILDYYDLKPDFLVDSNIDSAENLNGIKIINPNDIVFNKDMFIVITIKSETQTQEIKDQLKAHGLEENQNFCTFREYFDVWKMNATECLFYMEKQEWAFQDKILLMVPLLSVRNARGVIKFIRKYVEARNKERKEVVLLSDLKSISHKRASELVGTRVIDIPTFEECMESDIQPDILAEITEIERRKFENNNHIIRRDICIYKFYLEMLNVLKPEKVIMWGGWSITNYIVESIAKKKGIPYGYMEHGWLPGTYQVDPKGIMGQSEYAGSLEIQQCKDFVEDKYDIEQIKHFIKDTQLDTRIFQETKEDNRALENIDHNKKTIFLVGMDDYGMQMNPNNIYWSKYISSNVKSTEEALDRLVSICKENQYNLIFKPHPGNPVSDWIEKSNEIILVKKCAVDKLIKLADVVVSIGSAVDFKTLIYDKPLVQLGLNALVGKECTYVVKNKEDFKSKIEQAMSFGFTDKQRGNYNNLLQNLLQKYLWDDLTERTVRYGCLPERDFLNE